MNTLNSVLPANEARANFYRLFDEAGRELRHFKIVHRNKPPVIIMSAEEFEGWQETFDIMADKKLVQSINRGLKSKKRHTQAEVDKILGWNK